MTSPRQTMGGIDMSTVIDKLGFRNEDYTNATLGPNRDESFLNPADFIKQWQDAHPDGKQNFSNLDESNWYQSQREKQLASFFPSADAYNAYKSGDVNSINANWNAGVKNQTGGVQPQQPGPLPQPQIVETPTTSGLSTVINPNQQNTAPTPTTSGLSTVINPNQQTTAPITPTTGGLPTFETNMEKAANAMGGLPTTTTSATVGGMFGGGGGSNAPAMPGATASPPTTPAIGGLPTTTTNPIATTGPFIPTPVAGTTTAGATTANQGNNMALPSIFNPQVNPNVTQTQTAQTTAPDWYSNFLSGLNTSGQAAVNQGGIAPASTLQNMAYNTAPTAIGAGAPALAQANAAAANVAATPTTSLIGDYMNPYTQSVVKSIGDLGTQQFREFTDPAMTSYGVATGQFGGSRAQDIRAKAARDAAMNITAQQTQAMNTGFNNALTAAQNQQNLGLNTANVLGNLSSQAQSQGIGGLNALSTLGAQQQTLSQAERNYPMTALQNYANLIGGLNVPTGSTQTVTGPAGGGQMTSSVLNQILAMGTGGVGLFNAPYGTRTNPDGTPMLDKNGTPVKSTVGESILNYFNNSSSKPTANTAPVYTYPSDSSGDEPQFGGIPNPDEGVVTTPYIDSGAPTEVNYDEFGNVIAS